MDFADSKGCQQNIQYWPKPWFSMLTCHPLVEMSNWYPQDLIILSFWQNNLSTAPPSNSGFHQDQPIIWWKKARELKVEHASTTRIIRISIWPTGDAPEESVQCTVSPRLVCPFGVWSGCFDLPPLTSPIFRNSFDCFCWKLELGWTGSTLLAQNVRAGVVLGGSYQTHLDLEPVSTTSSTIDYINMAHNSTSQNIIPL